MASHPAVVPGSISTLGSWAKFAGRSKTNWNNGSTFSDFFSEAATNLIIPSVLKKTPKNWKFYEAVSYCCWVFGNFASRCFCTGGLISLWSAAFIAEMTVFVSAHRSNSRRRAIMRKHTSKMRDWRSEFWRTAPCDPGWHSVTLCDLHAYITRWFVVESSMRRANQWAIHLALTRFPCHLTSDTTNLPKMDYWQVRVFNLPGCSFGIVK